MRLAGEAHDVPSESRLSPGPRGGRQTHSSQGPRTGLPLRLAGRTKPLRRSAHAGNISRRPAGIHAPGRVSVRAPGYAVARHYAARPQLPNRRRPTQWLFVSDSAFFGPVVHALQVLDGFRALGAPARGPTPPLLRSASSALAMCVRSLSSRARSSASSAAILRSSRRRARSSIQRWLSQLNAPTLGRTQGVA